MNIDATNPQSITPESQEKLVYLIFASSAVKELDRQELSELCQQAETKNKKLGITGQLIYDGGNFLSVLEGESKAIQQVFSAISNDSRHHGLILIHEDVLTKRVFSSWSMDFQKHKNHTGYRMPIASAISSIIDRYHQD